jgi:hypothetical protein
MSFVRFGKGRTARRAPGTMNRMEKAYSEVIIQRQRIGEVEWWAYEGITLKLAPDTRYTPDFAVMLADGSIEFHEVKGFMEDDAWVKLKVAAEKFPFRFVLVKALPKKAGGGFESKAVGE